ncbi:MAG: hypothetical protein ACOX4O_10215 [Eubacteriales bacterium]|jgi:hypothetical protein
MSQTFREKYLGGASYKLIFSIISVLIALLMVSAFVVGIVAFFKENSEVSPIVAALKAFFNTIYLPSILILILAIIGILLFATITMIKETSGGSAKVTILLIAIFIFAILGTIKPLMDYRPVPTTGYIIVFFAILSLLFVFSIVMTYSGNAISTKEKRTRLLIVLPFAFLASFYIVSLIFAMIHHFKYVVEELELEDIFTGIFMPIFAIACLFIPIVIPIMLAEGDPEVKKTETVVEQAQQNEDSKQ